MSTVAMNAAGVVRVRAESGRGFRTKSARRRTLLRRANAQAQRRRPSAPKAEAWVGGELL